MTILPIELFECYTEDLNKGVHNFAAHTFKIALTNTAPNLATADELADITQIATGNGYSAGGYTVSGVSVSRTGYVTTVDGNDFSIAASGGNIGPFQYGVLYNDSSTGDRLIGLLQWTNPVTVLAGDSPTVRFPVDGIIITDKAEG